MQWQLSVSVTMQQLASNTGKIVVVVAVRICLSSTIEQNNFMCVYKIHFRQFNREEEVNDKGNYKFASRDFTSNYVIKRVVGVSERESK